MHESEKWKWSRSVVSDSSDPMDCSLPGSFIHGIFQARVLEWGAIAFSGHIASSYLLIRKQIAKNLAELVCFVWTEVQIIKVLRFFKNKTKQQEQQQKQQKTTPSHKSPHTVLELLYFYNVSAILTLLTRIHHRDISFARAEIEWIEKERILGLPWWSSG